MDKEKDLEYALEQMQAQIKQMQSDSYHENFEINELHSLKRKLKNQEQKIKHEQYMRRRYPSVNEAYKQYQMLLKLTKSHK